MTDMLVNLRGIKSDDSLENSLLQKNIRIFRATMPDRFAIVEWVKKNFSKFGAGECEAAFSQQPVSCFIAVCENNLIGVACYDATAKNFFGPTCVDESYRKLGVGKLLLVKSLEAMHFEGYQYAIIGGVGPQKFYEKVANATVIENEGLSIYDDFYKFSIDNK